MIERFVPMRRLIVRCAIFSLVAAVGVACAPKKRVDVAVKADPVLDPPVVETFRVLVGPERSSHGPGARIEVPPGERFVVEARGTPGVRGRLLGLPGGASVEVDDGGNGLYSHALTAPSAAQSLPLSFELYDSSATPPESERESFTLVVKEKPIPPPSVSDAELAGREVAKLPVLYFAHDSWVPLEESADVIASWAELIKKYPSVRFKIVGRCDEVGKEEYNDKLGWRRAATVQRDLVARGADASRLALGSEGKKNAAVCPTSRAERLACHAKDRRAFLEVLGD